MTCVFGAFFTLTYKSLFCSISVNLDIIVEVIRSRMEAPKLLIVDDEPRIREFFIKFFSAEGWIVGQAEDGIAAQKIINKEPFDVIVTDLKMPRMDGITLLKWINRQFPQIQKIILTAYGSVNAAISAVHEGAYDFISKPIENYEKLKITVQRAYDNKRLQQENAELIDALKEKNKELIDRLSELQLACDLMKEQSRVLKEDLVTAQKIQFHLLPQEFPKTEKVSFASFYQPSRNVGGDIFDVVQVDADNIIAYIADASGHGVSSAMMAVFIKQLLKPFKIEENEKFILSPTEVLSHLNDMIFAEGVQDTVFVTMAYVHIDLGNMKMDLATAGHPAIIIKRQDGRVEQIGCHCPALGIRRQSSFYDESVDISNGDIILMYTDGITDCENESGRQFGKEGLIDAVQTAGKSASDVYSRLVTNLKEFSAGRPQEDDMSMLLCAFTNEEIPVAQFVMPFEHKGKKEPEVVTHNHILQKQEGDKQYFLIQGKGTWKESRPLLNSLRGALDRDVSEVVIDFSSCRYLDSTFLGTLQQITETVEERGDIALVIQNVPGNILDTLDELVMEDVISRIVTQPVSLPQTMKEISVGSVDREQYAGHILETHELLSRLSEKNREKFQLLVETLRKASDKHSSDDK